MTAPDILAVLDEQLRDRLAVMLTAAREELETNGVSERFYAQLSTLMELRRPMCLGHMGDIFRAPVKSERPRDK